MHHIEQGVFNPLHVEAALWILYLQAASYYLKNFLEKFSGYSIISEILTVLAMKGWGRCFRKRISCRGEVIPFEADTTGAGHCAQKVFQLLH